MVLFGNDVSSNNGAGNVDLQNQDYSFVKLTEGNDYINPSAYNQSSQTQAAGKLLGYYHYLSPNVDVLSQAKLFLNTLRDDANAADIILMLDVEEEALTGDEPKVFMDYVYSQTGKRMLVYMGLDFVNSPKYNWSDIAGTYPLMLAGYPLNDGGGYTSDLQSWADKNYFSGLKWWQIVTAWQYTNVPYDRSVFYGDKNTWHIFGTPESKNGDSATANTPQPLDKMSEINQLAKKIVDLSQS